MKAYFSFKLVWKNHWCPNPNQHSVKLMISFNSGGEAVQKLLSSPLKSQETWLCLDNLLSNTLPVYVYLGVPFMSKH